MAFFSVAFSAIVLLLITEPQTHAKPLFFPTPTSSQPGCNYQGGFYQPGEVIQESKCSKTVCTEFGVLVYDKACAFGTTTSRPMTGK